MFAIVLLTGQATGYAQGAHTQHVSNSFMQAVLLSGLAGCSTLSIGCHFRVRQGGIKPHGPFGRPYKPNSWGALE